MKRAKAEPRTLLKEIVRLKSSYGSAAASEKLDILKDLEGARMRSARDLFELHETLCFLRAYPDDERVLARVERILSAFASRSDVKRWRRSFVSSGIAGTDIDYSFFWPTARWLATRWPERLTINWPALERKRRDALRSELFSGMPYALRPLAKKPREPRARALLASLGDHAADAEAVIRTFEAIPGDDFIRESLYDRIDVELTLEAGGDAPSRTRARLSTSPVRYFDGPPSRGRPDLRKEAKRAPSAMRESKGREATEIIELAKEAMVTRSRDLDVFAYPNPKDVRVVDDSEGLQFACIGTEPSRRLLLPAAYGFLTLRNGVPIGYIQADMFLGSAEISFNTFETFRGGEAAYTFARFLSVLRHVFGVRSFTIEPYQLGLGNDEALSSGAWWFYYKLGFRPEDPEAEELARSELAAMERDRKHRSSRATLKKLARRYLYFDLGRRGLRPPIARLGVEVALALVEHGIDEESARDEALGALGLRDLAGLSKDERLAFVRFAPILAASKSAKRWSRDAQRRALETIKAKGAEWESDYLAAMTMSPELGRAISSLARQRG